MIVALRSCACHPGKLAMMEFFEPLPSLDASGRADAGVVKAWRKTARQSLLRRRLAIDDVQHARWSVAIHAHLLGALRNVAGMTIAVYWPYRREFDPRPLAAELAAKGAICALPVVATPKAPLVFREWREGAPLVSGEHGIPVPAAGREVSPDVVLAPLIGFDTLGYRLGYGTGYFDRTLGALGNRPVSVGVGFGVGRIDSIYPQPHDVPLDFIVTECGICASAAGGRLTSGGAKEMRAFGAPCAPPSGGARPLQ